MGNLVGQAFAPIVRKEISLRQQLYDIGRNDGYYDSNLKIGGNVYKFTNNASFARLASGVDLQVDPEQVPFERQADYNTRLNQLKSHFNIGSGDALARKVILSGGVSELPAGGITEATIDLLEQKTGFIGDGGKYTSGAYGFGGTTFGYKPMPHLTSIKTSYYNQGALAKADINIKCYSPEQLEILELLYLRPGFTLFAEWGHNYFLQIDSDNPDSDNAYIDTYDSTEYLSQPLRLFFQKGVSAETMYTAIKNQRNRYRLSYDGFFGTVVNFSYKFNPDASYDVTVKAVSQGSVVESLKGNTAPSSFTEDDKANKPQSLLSQQLLRLKKSLPNLVYTNELTTSGGGVATGNAQVTEDYKAIIPDAIFQDVAAFSLKIAGTPADPESEDGPFQSVSTRVIPYLNFGGLMYLLEKYHSIYREDGSPILKFRRTALMHSFPGHFSADPTVCLKSFNTVYAPSPDFASIETIRLPELVNLNLPGNLNGLGYGNIPLYSEGFVRELGLVGISFDTIEGAINKTIKPNGKVEVLKFLKAVLDEVKGALGGINEFRVMLDEELNEVYVLDEGTHISTNDVTPTKFQSYGIGTGDTRAESEGTFIRNINFTTQISNELAATIAIGAQANGNQLGENSTGLSSYNAGLTDRHLPAKKTETTGAGTADTGPQAWQQRLLELQEVLRQTYQSQIAASNLPGLGVEPANLTRLKSLNADYCRWALGYLSEEKNFMPSPSFIPFDIELEMQGISGIKLFERFTIDDKILPFPYKGKINFIVTGINHTIQNNEWITSLKGKAVPILKSLKKYDIQKGADPPPLNPLPPSGGGNNPASGPSGTARKTFVKGVDMEGWYYQGPTEKIIIVLHHTAGSLTANSKGTVNWWNHRYLYGIPDKDPKKNVPPGEHVGTHYIVDRDGSYDRCMELPEWSGHIAEGTGISKVAIGIEIQNIGPLSKSKGGVQSVGPDGKTPKPYKDKSYWEEYTDAQLKTVKKVIAEIRKKYPGIPLTYNYDDWFPQKGSTSKTAMNRTPGVFTHNSYRTDKVDVGPTPKMVAFGKSLAGGGGNPYIDPILKGIADLKKELETVAVKRIGARWYNPYKDDSFALDKAIKEMRAAITAYKKQPAALQKALSDFIKGYFPKYTYKAYAAYLLASRNTSYQNNNIKKVNKKYLPKQGSNDGKFYKSLNNLDSKAEDIWEEFIDTYYLAKNLKDKSVDADL